MTAKKILVVDDEFQITRVLRQSLTAHRYDVRTAADGWRSTRSVTGTPISLLRTSRCPRWMASSLPRDRRNLSCR